ncbi:MAG: radical SAM protein [Clostridia bacterium]|nr:radical SAM protein [Clostridia bacterium]
MAERAPVIAFDRHRMTTDGEGVTTLVCFHGCPLRCKWCLNPFSFEENTRRQMLTATELYEEVKIDELYFIATNGGVTFGGGEPLLYAPFIKEFRAICGEGWHLCAETSLAVPYDKVQLASECIDIFYVDCKDTNPRIYEAYTGKGNELMMQNLEKLIGLVGAERIVLRLPLIPEYNTEEDRKNSLEILKTMGVAEFDLFTYKIKK